MLSRSVHVSPTRPVNASLAKRHHLVQTRIQNANFESKVSGATVFKDLIKNEGPSALFKGLTPKIGELKSAI
jgi:hypothetical protein